VYCLAGGGVGTLEHTLFSGHDGTLGVWDMRTGSLLEPIEAHARMIMGIDLNPELGCLATGWFPPSLYCMWIGQCRRLRILQGRLAHPCSCRSVRGVWGSYSAAGDFWQCCHATGQPRETIRRSSGRGREQPMADRMMMVSRDCSVRQSCRVRLV
jgi:hypothetical protein